MFILNSMLLGLCLLYGLLIAWLFNNGENFNQIWIWWSFITFVINHMVLTGRLQIKCEIENEEKEEE